MALTSQIEYAAKTPSRPVGRDKLNLESPLLSMTRRQRAEEQRERSQAARAVRAAQQRERPPHFPLPYLPGRSEARRPDRQKGGWPVSDAWMAHGACAETDPELFFPEGESAPFLSQIDQAKAVCARCPARGECLSYALDNRLRDGIWGGTTPKERANAERRRQRMVSKVVAL